jgi:multiple sugar transport system substrate-binding protein
MKQKLGLALAALLAAAFCAPVFAGGSKAAAPADGVVTLQWAMWDKDLTVYYQPLIDAYKAKNPNVKIELVDLGSADFMTVLSTQLSGGADLDVLTIKDIPGYGNLVRQNRMEPLNAYIKSSNIDTKQYGGVVEQLTANGEVYCLPFRSDFYLIYYNKDIFDKAGVPYPSNDLTLDQYDALARRLTSGSGAGKIYGTHYHTWRSQVQLFGILDGKHTLVDGNYDFLAPYYNQVLKEQDDGIVQAYATLKTSGTHYSGVFFNNQIAMMHQGTWFIATQIDKVKSGESLSKNWGLAKYPHPNGVPAGTSPGTITGIGVNRNSKNKDAALDFMKFITGPEGAAVLAKTGTIPAIMTTEVVNAISSLPGFPTDANSKEALKVAQTYLEFPLHEKSADIEVALNEEHDAIMTKNKSAADGIKAMNDRVGRILGR